MATHSIIIVTVRTHEVHPLNKYLHTETVLLTTGIVLHRRVLELLLCVCAWSLSRVQLFATPCTMAHQAPLSMGIPQARILEWIAMPSSRGFFPAQGSNPGLLHCRRILHHLSHQGSFISTEHISIHTRPWQP